jgi:predicted HicB family RNase H-like nuclease
MANLNLRLDEGLKEKIKMAAEKEGLSVAAFIKQTIKRYVNVK